MPKIFAALLALVTLSACATELSHHRSTPSDLGTPVSTAAMLESLSRPGIVGFEKVTVLDWHFPNTIRPRSGGEWHTRQLDAQIYFYAVRHPRFGLYLIDAGMPAGYEDYMGLVLRRVIRKDYGVQMRLPTEAWVRQTEAHPSGVFVTHLHYDHVLGAVALDPQTPIYLGPGEGGQRSFYYHFIGPPARRALRGHPVREWRMGPAGEGALAALDVFGDGSVFALHAPGHTPGSMAFLVNATTGVQLITGDAVHSREGLSAEFQEATGFEQDLPQIFRSQDALRALVARIPGVTVHPGHQSFPAPN